MIDHTVHAFTIKAYSVTGAFTALVWISTATSKTIGYLARFYALSIVFDVRFITFAAFVVVTRAAGGTVIDIATLTFPIKLDGPISTFTAFVGVSCTTSVTIRNFAPFNTSSIL